MPNAISAMYHDTASQHCFMRLVTREKLFSQKQAAILKTGKQIKLKSDYNTNTKQVFMTFLLEFLLISGLDKKTRQFLIR